MTVSVRLDDNSEELLRFLNETAKVALEECGLAAEGYAKRLCPVDTGNLRNSISHTQSDNTEYIGTNVEYAPYVELGTSRTRAQPYLKPAVANNVSVYQQIIKRHLQG